MTSMHEKWKQWHQRPQRSVFRRVTSCIGILSLSPWNLLTVPNSMLWIIIPMYVQDSDVPQCWSSVHNFDGWSFCTSSHSTKKEDKMSRKLAPPHWADDITKVCAAVGYRTVELRCRVPGQEKKCYFDKLWLFCLAHVRKLNARWRIYGHTAASHQEVMNRSWFHCQAVHVSKVSGFKINLLCQEQCFNIWGRIHTVFKNKEKSLLWG